MQIELPTPSWTAAPSPQDDAHTWTLPELLAGDAAGAVEALPLGESLRITVGADVLPAITITL